MRRISQFIDDYGPLIWNAATFLAGAALCAYLMKLIMGL